MRGFRPRFPPMPLHRLVFLPDRPTVDAFWDAAAAAIDQPAPPVRVFVPAPAHIEPMRAALWRRHARPGVPWRPPLVTTLELAAARFAPCAVRPSVARTLEIFDALGRMPSARGSDRMSVAQRLSGALDKLDLVELLERVDALDERAREAYGARGWLAAQAEIESLRALRLAVGSAADPMRARFDSCARLAAGCTVDAVVRWQRPQPFERAYATQAAAAGVMLEAELDIERFAFDLPALAAAWPEAFGRPFEDLRSRVGRSMDARAPKVLRADRREDEAQAAAQWICQELSAGARELRIVAADLWVARRLRALLERAGVQVDDCIGWRLSTTVAASAVVRWLDVATTGAPHAAVTAWMASPHVFPQADKGPLLAWIDQATARGSWLAGWEALVAARAVDDEWQPRLAGLAQLAQAQAGRGTAAGHAAALREALHLSGTWTSLGTDAAGRQVIDAFERLADALAGSDARIDGTEFRSLLAGELEQRVFTDGAVESPVRMVGLEAAALAPCDGLVVVGANRDLLPPAETTSPFFTDGLAARLGLPTRNDDVERTLRQLAFALALAPRAALTCRDDTEEGVERSAWVERLLAVRGEAIEQRARQVAHGQRARLQARPMRSAGARGAGLLPQRMSVSDLEQLATCPYRFWGQALLRLREPQQPMDAPQRREMGTVVHAILHDFHTALGDAPFDASGARALLEQVTRQHAQRLVAAGGFLPLVAEWRASIPRYIDWLDKRIQDGWRWQAGEHPLEIEFQAAGVRLVLKGKVDRIDVRVRADGTPEHAVIDYKAGASAGPKKRAVQPHEYAQLPLYVLLLEQAGLAPVEAAFLSIDRDRVELLPMAQRLPGRRTQVRVEPVAVAMRWHARIEDALGRIDAGDTLEAMGHADDCDTCTVQGLCRKQHWWQEHDR